MSNSHIYAALARERRDTLLAEADAARLARQARQGRQQVAATAARSRRSSLAASWLRPAWSRLDGHRPRSAPVGNRVVLRDGSQVLIRQVRSADAQLLADGFARLSARSRWMRFLTTKKELSTAELQYFTDVDHHDHEALGALDHRDGSGVGIARYIRSAEDPHAADIAVTIVDDWQGRGLGTELLAQLSARACQEGIRRFTALVADENAAVAGLLRNKSASLVRREAYTLEYEITLACGQEHEQERGALLSI
jgi:RimJ/RimL family protein N-acetyltransferase